MKEYEKGMKEYEREEKEMQWGKGKGRKEQRMEKREREGKRIGKERKGKERDSNSQETFYKTCNNLTTFYPPKSFIFPFVIILLKKIATLRSTYELTNDIYKNYNNI